MTKKIKQIVLETLPVILMIGLISPIQNDYTLTGIYILIIAVALYIKRIPGDMRVLVFGFCVMIVSEYLFISTEVEIFLRDSLFGIMPLWLPFLWAYGFVAIKRSVKIMES